MTCNKTNVASKKSIIKNGGVKENEVVDDFEILERYWTDLKKPKYMLKLIEEKSIYFEIK